MRLEINAGGLSGMIAIAEYQYNMSGFISSTESVIDSFKAVRSETYSLSGGVGDLQGALDNINARITQEETKKNAAVQVRQKSNDFLDLAIRVDQDVARLVDKNRDQFYRVHPWLKPASITEEEKPWYQKAWDWLCGAGETIAEGAKQAWTWIKDTAKKAWDGLVEFYNEHKKIIDTILIVVGAVLAIAAVIATGGVALVPLLGALGVSTATAIAISTTVAVVAVVSTVVSSTMNIIDVWCEIDNPIFNMFQMVFNITSTVSNLVYSVGNIYNSIKKINPQQYVASHTATGTPTGYTNVNQLSTDQVDALTRYSGNDCYDNINNSLRGIEPVKPENVDTIRTMQNVLDNSSLPQDMTLYRGTTTKALGELQNLSPNELLGKTFVENGFMSTSTSPSVANAFTDNMQIIINAAKGSHALDIASICSNPVEAEILFSSGQQMLITGAEKIRGILYLTVTIL